MTTEDKDQGEDEMHLKRELSLKKLGYENLDKIVNVEFLKTTVFKSLTKKDFCLFISEHPDVQEFMKSLEGKVLASHDDVKTLLLDYLSTNSDEVSAFKLQLKELKRKAKLEEEKVREQVIFEKKLQELMNQGKKKELEEKLGVTLDKLGVKVPAAAEAPSDGKPIKPNLKFNKKETSSPSQTQTPMDIDKKSMDLGTFFAFLQQVIKNDLLVIKDMNGNKLVVHDLDLDVNPEKIRMKVRSE